MAEQQDEDEELKRAYANVFSHPDTPIVLADLIEKGGVFDVVFLGDRRQWLPEAQAGSKDGSRRIVLRILQFSGHMERMMEAVCPGLTIYPMTSKATKQ